MKKMAGAAPILAAAFDGPLKRGLGIIGRYRTAERMLTRRLRPFAGKPGQASAPVGKLLNDHANRCVTAVLDHCAVSPAEHSVAIHERAVVEAFPSSFLGVMIDDPKALKARRGDRSDTFFDHLAIAGVLNQLLEHCLPGRSPSVDPITVTNHDDRAALVCALTALCIGSGDYTAVGDEDGWIVLPPASFVRAWAIAALDANAAKEAGTAFVRASPGL